MKPTISFVIPALNEEANIANAVREAVAALGDRFRDYELLLFDDGSTDRTGADHGRAGGHRRRPRPGHP